MNRVEVHGKRINEKVCENDIEKGKRKDQVIKPEKKVKTQCTS